MESWFTLAILVAAIVLFVTEWVRVDVVALGVVVTLMVTRVLTPAEALAGFSNSAVLSITALFIVGGAVLQTGLAGMIGNRILAVAGSDETRLILVIMLAVALLSGFMSDTGTVAVLLPAIVSMAHSANLSPSKLLIPLAFGSLLGGASTLIGTPPNLIVADLLRTNALPTFGFFDFTPLGVVLVIGGVLFMVLLGRRLLPDNKPHTEVQDVETPQELIDRYRLPDNLYKLRIRTRSPLIGQTLGDSDLGHDYDISVLEILRPNKPRTVMKLGEQKLVLQSEGHTAVEPDIATVLQRDDLLLVQAPDARIIQRASARLVLAIKPVESEDHATLISDEAGIAEVVLPPRSTLIGKTLSQLRFGGVYKLTVLGLRRPGHDGAPLNLKDTPLAFGDTLLVQGTWASILALRNKRRDFVVLGLTTMLSPQQRKRAPVALLVLVGMLVLMVSGLTSVVTASMLGALAMVVTGCLTMDGAYDAVDWKSVVLIAGMFPMSVALEKVGLVDQAAAGFTGTLGSMGPLWVMAGLFLMTSLFTQVLSNTATTVLVAPIALAAAINLGVQPHALLMAVAVAASMAFASPVASPVNTLVMGAGNYRFSDFLKVGVPMIGVTLLIAVMVLPLLFPF